MNVTMLRALLRRLLDATLHQSANARELAAEIDRLKAGPRFQDPKCLIPFGHKVYSQADEDGILREIFARPLLLTLAALMLIQDGMLPNKRV